MDWQLWVIIGILLTALLVFAAIHLAGKTKANQFGSEAEAAVAKVEASVQSVVSDFEASVRAKVAAAVSKTGQK